MLRVEFMNRSASLLSAGADGILKLWRVTTGECVRSYDQHDGRVWAIAVDELTQTHRGRAVGARTGDTRSEQGTGAKGTGGEDTASPVLVATGGSDATLVLWRDVTIEEQVALRTQQRDKILLYFFRLQIFLSFA